jgi:spore coat protein U-like protein
MGIKMLLRIMIAFLGAAIPASALALACAVQTAPATFGVYNPVSATAAVATGTIDISCTCVALVDCVAFAYRIDLAAGQSGTTTMRQMKAGAKTMNYNLYQDETYNTIWGAGISARSVLYLLTLFGSYQRNVVYAKAPAQQPVLPGNYVDTPVVTITY